MVSLILGILLKRIKSVDIDLYLLGYFLHPMRRLQGLKRGFFDKICNKADKIGRSMGFSEDDIRILIHQMRAFKIKSNYYDSLYDQDDPGIWWSTNDDQSGDFLQLVAMRIFALVPSSAGVERVFSTLSWIKNLRRNKFTTQNLEIMSQIYFYNLSGREKSADKNTFDDFCEGASEDFDVEEVLRLLVPLEAPLIEMEIDIPSAIVSIEDDIFFNDDANVAANISIATQSQVLIEEEDNL